ncbi:MAG: hypothetical protein ACFFD4_18670 [Candidatus Odinarchaeota archaeon]
MVIPSPFLLTNVYISDHSIIFIRRNQHSLEQWSLRFARTRINWHLKQSRERKTLNTLKTVRNTNGWYQNGNRVKIGS